MRRCPHALGCPAQRAAAHRIAHPRPDFEAGGIDHHQRLIIGGAQPHRAASGVNIPPFEVIAHLGAARDSERRRIDFGHGAIALFLHPHRTFACRQKARRIAQRGCADDRVGGRIDLLQHLALAADRPDRIEPKGEIPGFRRDRDGGDHGVGGRINPRDLARRIARHPDRSCACDHVGFALGIGEAGGDLGFERGGFQVHAPHFAALAIGDPQRTFGNRHRPARARHGKAGELFRRAPLFHPPIIGDPRGIAINRDEIGKAGDFERLFDKVRRGAGGGRGRRIGRAGRQQSGCHDERERAGCGIRGHRGPFHVVLGAMRRKGTQLRPE